MIHMSGLGPPVSVRAPDPRPALGLYAQMRLKLEVQAC
jgi:hypothetical protein